MEEEGGGEDPGQDGGEPIKISGTPPRYILSMPVCCCSSCWSSLSGLKVTVSWVMWQLSGLRTEG